MSCRSPISSDHTQTTEVYPSPVFNVFPSIHLPSPACRFVFHYHLPKMHYINVVALAMTLVSAAQATINTGEDASSNYMWVDGKSACTAKRISAKGDNPCGVRVTLENGRTCA
ncbi:hypothetical protein PG990_011674 [Apiospora arundinis]